MHSGTGDVTSTALTAGTYTYKFKLSTPAGIKASFARADGVAAPASVQPGQTNAEVEVSGSIVVTEKTVVTLKVPAKETLSFYEKKRMPMLRLWVISLQQRLRRQYRVRIRQI